MNDAKPLHLANARYAEVDRYPMLLVDVGGRTAELMPEVKPTVHAAGLVPLGGEFADLCPEVTLDPDGTGGTTLRGFSDDPRLFRLFDAFLLACADGTFTPGPVAIPD